ncbi:unnamed protein product [Brachionus calyciflorus]|uniref:Uncharacterized protein n=1 Tax=Brachionus calyciflorus TaxID=104777 RepID=A0A813TJC4_9BILA|nr:unnamed protein product [Brachionus calyciflorus]
MLALDHRNASFTKKENRIPKSKLSNEVVNWALGFSENSQNQKTNFDELTDDSYLDNILPYSNETGAENDLEKRQKIREILQNVRNTNRSRNRRPQKVQIEHKLDENEPKNQIKKSKNSTKQKFDHISNGMSRALPGVLQQNITIERNYFKDLILLSKQRYTVLKSLDFEKKMFTRKQDQKGFIKTPIKKTDEDLLVNKQIKETNKLDSVRIEKVKPNQNMKLVRPASVTNCKFSEPSIEDFDQDSYQSRNIIRPKTTLPYFNSFELDDDYDSSKNNSKIKTNNLNEPLEDCRFKQLISSMSDKYNTDIKINEKRLPCSSLRKIINRNNSLKDFKSEKFEGYGWHEIQVKTKVFERLVDENNFKV